MIAVALMTQGGFAGNLRYVALPGRDGLHPRRGGLGRARARRPTDRCGRRGPAPRSRPRVAALFVPFVVTDLDELETGRAQIDVEADFYGANLEAGDRQGGRGGAR